MAVKKKVILTQIKLQIPGGEANPAPPVGPALGRFDLFRPEIGIAAPLQQGFYYHFHTGTFFLKFCLATIMSLGGG